MQYTGGWEDLALLTILSAIGCVCKYFNISRPAILVAYVVAFKIDEYFWGTLQLYGYKQWKPGLTSMEGFRWGELFSFSNHPIFLICIVISIISSYEILVVPTIEVTVVPDGMPDPITKSPTSISVLLFTTKV